MLQSLSLRDVVVSWPTRPTKANGWGGPPKPFRWTSAVCAEIVLRRQFYSGERRAFYCTTIDLHLRRAISRWEEKGIAMFKTSQASDVGSISTAPGAYGWNTEMPRPSVLRAIVGKFRRC